MEPGIDPEMRPLDEVTASLIELGYTGTFEVTSDAMLRCDECGHTVAPEDVEMREFHRYEGHSDPADMEAVLGLVCSCGCKGTLTAPYGANADGPTGDVLRRVPDARP